MIQIRFVSLQGKKKIKELKQKRNEIRDHALKMYDDPNTSVSDRLLLWDEADKIDDKMKRLEKMNEIEENFDKNINLEEYRNSNGSLYIYKSERFLDTRGGKALPKSINHEGVAFGNDKKKFYTDYGTEKEFLDVRFWDSEEKKDNWKKTELVDVSYKSNDEIKEILFGEGSEERNNHDDYSIFNHNCKHYVKQKIDELAS